MKFYFVLCDPQLDDTVSQRQRRTVVQRPNANIIILWTHKVSQSFSIPKQSDQNLLAALGSIKRDFEGLMNFWVTVTPHHGGNSLEILDAEPEKSETIQYLVSEHSRIAPYLNLVDTAPPQNRKTAITIRRLPERITEEVTVHWNSWAAQLPPQEQSRFYVKMFASARKHLQATTVEASLAGTGDDAWSRYRDSQTAILNSLQETAKTLLVDVGRKATETEKELRTKYSQLETELRAESNKTQERLASEYAQKLRLLEDRGQDLKKREESFNTKEARYVARQEQKNQLEQIQKWLEGWSLTKGTTRKRTSVTWTYIVGIALTASITVWFGSQTVEILKGKDFSQVIWWQWLLLSMKSILPLAACMTFLIYLIRWNSAWARQHAEEEFRNRARALDIGRSTWLLEAVRDSQDHQKEFPPDLLKELSKNLFSPQPTADGGELGPQALSDMLWQGISSLRLKSHDGTEIEAKRDNKT